MVLARNKKAFHDFLLNIIENLAKMQIIYNRTKKVLWRVAKS